MVMVHFPAVPGLGPGRLSYLDFSPVCMILNTLFYWLVLEECSCSVLSKPTLIVLMLFHMRAERRQIRVKKTRATN